MSAHAVVIVPASSGVSAKEANEAILAVIHDRVQTICRDIDTTANGVRAIAGRCSSPFTLSDEAIAAEVHNLSASIERLMTLHQSLELRLEAYGNQRRAARKPDADDPFADPTPVLKAS